MLCAMKRTMLALALLLLTPAAARADRVTIGSDLAAPATAARSDPNDIVFWPRSLPGGTVDVPVRGQAIIMRLKGGTQQPDGPSSQPDYDQMRFVVLRPQGDGTWRTTATSVPHRAPVIGKGADANTITEFTSVDPLCVEQGDRIGLVSVGGYDARLFPRGLPYQVFAPAPGAVLNEFRAGGAIAQGQTVVRATGVADVQLLLQVVVGTGPSARPTCGGTAPSGSDPGTFPEPSDPPGTGTPAATGRVRIAKPDRAPRMFDGKVRLTLGCPGSARCAGVLSLWAKGKRIGRRAYAFDAGERDGVSVKLTRKGRRMARRAGRLRVIARATWAGGTATRVVRVKA
jgi:hypothetical protein